jgi:hypothetical protein
MIYTDNTIVGTESIRAIMREQAKAKRAAAAAMPPAEAA